jgi:hypothetical protein
MTKSDDKRRALALSSGLGRTALVFEDNDVVGLLRIAIEREGGQSAFARHHGINRSQLNTWAPRLRSLSGFARRTSSSERTASFGVAKISLVGRNWLFIPKDRIALIFFAGMTRY